MDDAKKIARVETAIETAERLCGEITGLAASAKAALGVQDWSAVRQLAYSIQQKTHTLSLIALKKKLEAERAQR